MYKDVCVCIYVSLLPISGQTVTLTGSVREKWNWVEAKPKEIESLPQTQIF